MAREYVCKVILSDDYFDEDLTRVDDLNSLENGHLPFEELIVVANNEEDCSVSYEVRDL